MFPFLATISREDRSWAGGKAANLGELARAGVAVPQGFVIPASVAARFGRACLAAIPVDGSAPLTAWLNDSRRRLLEMPIGADVEKSILQSFDQLGASRTAVRSSATVEDSTERSFAGVFESVLNVSRSDVLSAIKQCWVSAFAPRVGDYLKARDIPKVSMAAIVQDLVVPDVSGVCFTEHPVSGHPDEMIIEIAWGFGDLLVGGRVSPDSYVYHWPSRSIVSRLSGGQDVARRLVQGELLEIPVLPALRRTEKIAARLLHSIAEDCTKIARHFGRPQDIEFAVQQDAIVFLQSRPITTGGRRQQ